MQVKYRTNPSLGSRTHEQLTHYECVAEILVSVLLAGREILVFKSLVLISRVVLAVMFVGE